MCIDQHELTGLSDLAESIARWKPDLLAWHVASSWRNLPAMLRSISKPILLFEHHYCRGFELNNVPSQLRFRTMLRCSYRTARCIVAVSHAQGAWMKEARLVSGTRLRVLCSSRPLDAFLSLPAPVWESENSLLRLLAYGRFTPQKGFDRLIRALRSVPDAPFHLRLVGDGPQRQELESLALGDPRIEVKASSDDIPGQLAQADVVIIPSRWEPWGNVCLEARAAARPVVVADVDGLREQVRHCGLLIPSSNNDSEATEALRSSLIELLDSSPQQRQLWSQAARDSTRRAWDQYLHGWSELLAEFR
jgi:glycosyltransferase involved in cell wall biosynthesis